MGHMMMMKESAGQTHIHPVTAADDFEYLPSTRVQLHIKQRITVMTHGGSSQPCMRAQPCMQE
jgi:hypothetical protein